VIKVGLLLPQNEVPLWVNEVINYLKNNPKYEICFVLRDGGIHKNSKQHLVYRLLRKLDRTLLPLSNSPFKRVTPKLDSENQYLVKTIRKQNSDYFPEDIIQLIKSYSTDFILRFGFKILRGEILNVSKYGILSLHHGDIESYRGGPPAFWEVYHQYPITGVSLQVLTEKLDAGKIVDRCFLNTYKFSFNRNQHRIYWAGEKLLKDNLEKIAEVGIERYFHFINESNQNIKPGKLYRTPKNFIATKILIWYLFNNIFLKFKRFFIKPAWKLELSKNINLNSLKDTSFVAISNNRNNECADPFILTDNNLSYLFFEERNLNNKKAHISLQIFDNVNKSQLLKSKKVLEEAHHLSYPFVLKHDDEYYLLPESSQSNKLTLYKTENFPYDWVNFRTIISNRMVYDPTLFKHSDGCWYLFCTAKEKGDYSSNAYLHIYYSEDLLAGEFKPHPANPIYKDVRISRMAGNIISLNGKLYRPFQVCSPSYGSNMNFAEIVNLSKVKYEEIITSDAPIFKNTNFKNRHTINISDNFIVTDVLVSKVKLW
jgi:folate-dependent phosphoribosylglycinamide formyltransferase PurN